MSTNKEMFHCGLKANNLCSTCKEPDNIQHTLLECANVNEPHVHDCSTYLMYVTCSSEVNHIASRNLAEIMN